MINILLPIAGFAKRFTDCGYTLPKPLIPVSGTPMIKLALASLLSNVDQSKYRLIFVVRDDHRINNDIESTLTHLFKGWQIEIATVDHVTQGTLCSCLIAKDNIRPDEPLIIYTPDVCFESEFDIEKDFINTNLDGYLLTFKANSTAHSYVAYENSIAIKTAEKVVISSDAIVGVYGFKTGKMFLDCANKAIESGIKVNNEFYVAPIYNFLIEDGKRIGVNRVEKMHVLGTPEDLVFYENLVARYSSVSKLAICCDHSGFQLKEELLKVLEKKGINFTDFGTYSAHDSDHYDSLKPCVEYLAGTEQTLGIAICSTGQGFNIAANKVKGIRSVLIHNSYTAKMGRKHNAANFFCLSAHNTQIDDLESIVTAIVGNTFDGGRHATRIRRIANDPLFIS